MPRQMTVDDIIISQIQDETRRAVEAEYVRRREEDELPEVRSSQEAYGLLIESTMNVDNAVKLVKTASSDALKCVSAGSRFAEPAGDAHSAGIDVATAAINLAVIAMHISYEITALYPTNEPTPLEEMAEEETLDVVNTENE